MEATRSADKKKTKLVISSQQASGGGREGEYLRGNRVNGQVGNVASVLVGPVKLVAVAAGLGRHITNGTVAEDDRGTQTSLRGHAGEVHPVARELSIAAPNGCCVGSKVDQGPDPGSIRHTNGIQDLQRNEESGFRVACGQETFQKGPQ